MVDNSDDETHFPDKLLLSNRQVADLHKSFASNLSVNIKLSKTRLSKIVQSGGYLGRLIGPLLKTVIQPLKSVIQPLAESVLIPLGLTAAASAADAEIHKKILGSGTATLIMSNDEMEDMKIVKSLEDSGLLLKGVIEKVIEIFLINKSTIITNIYRIQAYNSVMCGYFCIGFIDFMLKDKSLTDFTNLFSRNNFKYDDIILNYFKNG